MECIWPVACLNSNWVCGNSIGILDGIREGFGRDIGILKSAFDSWSKYECSGGSFMVIIGL